MSATRIDTRTAIDGVLVTAAGAAVRLDSTVPGRRPGATVRRRRPHPDDRRQGEEDTVTLHEPDETEAGPDPVEALRRRGFRRPA